MALFLKLPDYRHIPPVEFELLGACTYRSDIANQLVVVPDGFRTDWASIPRVFRSLIPKVGRHIPAAVVHDYLVRLEGFSRVLADRVFLEAMKVLGVPWWKRYAMYTAVSLLTGWKKLKGEA